MINAVKVLFVVMMPNALKGKDILIFLFVLSILLYEQEKSFLKASFVVPQKKSYRFETTKG